MDASPLETERLLLRLPSADDAQPMLEIHEDPETLKRVVVTAPLGGITVAWRNVAMMVGHWQLRGYGQWVVEEKQTGLVVGRVGLWHPEGWPGLELGWIIRRSHWGRGLATEAARAALTWTWAHVQTDRVISLIDPGSRASIRVAEKIGAALESHDRLNGAPVHVYAMYRPRMA
jgi:RimJ/RimL family protein N-acetyltransferase